MRRPRARRAARGVAAQRQHVPHPGVGVRADDPAQLGAEAPTQVRCADRGQRRVGGDRGGDPDGAVAGRPAGAVGHRDERGAQRLEPPDRLHRAAPRPRRPWAGRTRRRTSGRPQQARSGRRQALGAIETRRPAGAVGRPRRPGRGASDGGPGTEAGRGWTRRPWIAASAPRPPETPCQRRPRDRLPARRRGPARPASRRSLDEFLARQGDVLDGVSTDCAPLVDAVADLMRGGKRLRPGVLLLGLAGRRRRRTARRSSAPPRRWSSSRRPR